MLSAHAGGGSARMRAHLRGQIARKFKASGLFLRGNALGQLESLLVSYSADLAPEDVMRALDMVVEAAAMENLDSNMVDEQTMLTVLNKLDRRGEEQIEVQKASGSDIQIISAFEAPRFAYHSDRKQFLPAPATRALHSRSAAAKAELFRERFKIVKQRTLRNALFTRPPDGLHTSADYLKLTPIDALIGLGEDSMKEDAPPLVILGSLIQLQEGRFYLEDLDGQVEIDFSDATCCTGMVTENSIVLAEGHYSDNVFHVQTLGMPPPEPKAASREVFGPINFFGGEYNSHDEARLRATEAGNEDAMIIIVSDCHLDQPKTMAKLRTMFAGYSTMDPQPVAFVFFGDFTMEPPGPRQATVLKDALDELSELILEHNFSAETRFVFVPGPRDPGPGDILPRPPLPEMCTQRMRARVAGAEFTSNPARMRYCTQELVFFREDVVNKMRRNCIRPPEEEDGTSIKSHLVKTLVDQAHLCPLPLHVRPTYWHLDHALTLYPMPDVLCLADRFDPYYLQYEGLTALNPGSFHQTDGSFLVFFPARAASKDKALFDRRVEFSKID